MKCKFYNIRINVTKYDVRFATKGMGVSSWLRHWCSHTIVFEKSYQKYFGYLHQKNPPRSQNIRTGQSPTPDCGFVLTLLFISNLIIMGRQLICFSYGLESRRCVTATVLSFKNHSYYCESLIIHQTHELKR